MTDEGRPVSPRQWAALAKVVDAEPTPWPDVMVVRHRRPPPGAIPRSAAEALVLRGLLTIEPQHSWEVARITDAGRRALRVHLARQARVASDPPPNPGPAVSGAPGLPSGRTSGNGPPP